MKLTFFLLLFALIFITQTSNNHKMGRVFLVPLPFHYVLLSFISPTTTTTETKREWKRNFYYKAKTDNKRKDFHWNLSKYIKSLFLGAPSYSFCVFSHHRAKHYFHIVKNKRKKKCIKMCKELKWKFIFRTAHNKLWKYINLKKCSIKKYEIG